MQPFFEYFFIVFMANSKISLKFCLSCPPVSFLRKSRMQFFSKIRVLYFFISLLIFIGILNDGGERRDSFFINISRNGMFVAYIPIIWSC
jgi:hypothetical protein